MVFTWPNCPNFQTPIEPSSMYFFSIFFKVVIHFSLAFNPEWNGWKEDFTYKVTMEEPVTHSKMEHILRDQKFVVTCYAEHSFREDSLIGSVVIDVFTALSGPPDHYHTLTVR